MEVINVKALIESANEKLKHTNIILDDMMKNKREYSSRDLSWRNLDLLKAMVLTVNELSMAFVAVVNRTMLTPAAELVSDDIEILEDEIFDEEAEDMGEYPNQESDEIDSEAEDEEINNVSDDIEEDDLVDDDFDSFLNGDENDNESNEEEGSEDQ